jgi:hypothetical protein
MVVKTSTKFTFLDVDQRKSFHDKWDKVRNMYDKWHWSGHVDLFQGKKDLEKEIEDLEDLSLAAYRALILLRKHLAAANNPDEYESELYSS